MARRLTPQGEARKAELLEHAAGLFAERGYHRTRVVDIVRAAGVAKGLFYWYFEHKDAVLRELIVETRLRLRRAQAASLRPLDSPLARVFAGTAASVRFVVEHRELYALMQIESQTGARFAADARSTTDIHAADAARVVAAGQRAGLVRDDDPPDVLAYGLIGSVLHWVYFHRTGRLTMPVDELAATVARWAVRSLASSAELAEAAEAEAVAGRPRAAPTG